MDEAYLAKAGPIAEATKELDGCEGIFVLTQSTGGEGLAIVLWRDTAAMEAAAAKVAADAETLSDMGTTITPGTVYDTVLQF
jgi:hypothetical protein